MPRTPSASQAQSEGLKSVCAGCWARAAGSRADAGEAAAGGLEVVGQPALQGPHLGDHHRADLRTLLAEQGAFGQQQPEAADGAGQIEREGGLLGLQERLGQGRGEEAGFSAGFAGPLAHLGAPDAHVVVDVLGKREKRTGHGFSYNIKRNYLLRQ